MTHDRPPGEALRCTFCGKSEHEVKKLVAGPAVRICDECVKICNEILDEAGVDAGPHPPEEVHVGVLICPNCRSNFALHAYAAPEPA